MDADIAQLTDRITELEATVESLRRGADHEPARTTRRLALRGAALAVGGAVAGGIGALGGARPASAADSDPMIIGAVNDSASRTHWRSSLPTASGTLFLFQAGSADTPTTPVINSVLTAISSNGATRAGIYSRSDHSNGAVGVYGQCTNAFKSTGVIGIGGNGVTGHSSDGSGIGVWGRSENIAVLGDTSDGIGVSGRSISGIGLQAISTTNVALSAASTSAAGTTSSGITGLIATGTSGAGLSATGNIGASVSGTTYGVSVTGTDKAALFLSASNHAITGTKSPPPARTDVHFAGEIDLDGNNDLWLCTSYGTPGTWRKLAGPSTAGAFHPLVPGRVYDSRAAAPGPIAQIFTGQSRLVNVAARRDLTTGAGVENNYVPAGASAISCNVTVVDTIGAGFLSINPGGVGEVRAATINWSASGQILNNGVTLTLNSQRELTVIAGGDPTAGTHVVIDVTGYYR